VACSASTSEPMELDEMGFGKLEELIVAEFFECYFVLFVVTCY
jgi:hypothetical protein